MLIGICASCDIPDTFSQQDKENAVNEIKGVSPLLSSEVSLLTPWQKGEKTSRSKRRSVEAAAMDSMMLSSSYESGIGADADSENMTSEEDTKKASGIALLASKDRWVAIKSQSTGMQTVPEDT